METATTTAPMTRTPVLRRVELPDPTGAERYASAQQQADLLRDVLRARHERERLDTLAMRAMLGVLLTAGMLLHYGPRVLAWLLS